MMDASLFIESWPLFADAVWASTIAGAGLGYLGVYLIAHRMIFLSASLSQIASLGVTLSYLVAIKLSLVGWLVSPNIWSIGLTLLAAIALMYNPKDNEQREAKLGTVFILGASGTILVGSQITQELQDIKSLLFGSAVAVVPEDFKTLAIGFGLIGLVHLVFRRGFDVVAIDHLGSKVRQLPTALLMFLLVTSIALAISLTTRTLGALPAFVFGIMPALIVLRWCPNLQRAKLSAALIGALCGGVGYFLSFIMDLPVGATQAAFALFLLIISATFFALWRKVRALKSQTAHP